MNNALTTDGRGQDGPKDAEPFFPSEGAFNSVVPLSEVGRAAVPAPLARVDPADLGKRAEAGLAREAHGAGWKEEEETTLVPARAGDKRRASRGSGAPAARKTWPITAAVVVLSVAVGLASGAYLVWSSQRAPEAQPSAQVAPANAAPAPPVAEEIEADAKAERVNEAAQSEKSGEGAQSEKSGEVARASAADGSPSLRSAPTPRTERPARAVAEAAKVTTAPKSARSQSAAPARPRVTTAERQPPAPPSSTRTVPVSSPPPSAKSSKVIQWP